MSVDFFDCEACGESVCECGRYFRCGQCGGKFCDECDKGECPVCSLRVVTDERLVAYLLKRLSWSRSKGEKEYRKAMEKKP